LTGRLSFVFLTSLVMSFQCFQSSNAVTTSLADHFKYVADAVNNINFLKAKSLNPQDNAKEIVDDSCKMLTELTQDSVFKEIVYKGFKSSSNAQLMEIIADLGKTNDLIDKESEAFGGIGVDRLSRIQALAAAIPLVKQFDASKLSPDVILSNVSDLQKASCSLSGRLEQTEAWNKKENALIEGVAGVAFVVANGMVAYASAGAAGYATTLSWPLGAGLMVNSVDHLINH
jgi:hypothetical protein